MNDNVTDPLKSTTQTSYCRIFIALAVLGPFLLIGVVWLANYALPPSDADAFKKPLFGVWAWLFGASGLATFIGGLLRTYGKVSTQKEMAVAEVTKLHVDSLIPGETMRFLGRGELGTVAAEGQSMAEMGRAPDFDIRDFDISGLTNSNVVDGVPVMSDEDAALLQAQAIIEQEAKDARS